MTINSAICNRAARRLGVVVSGQSLAGTEAQDFHTILQSVLMGLPGLVFRGRWVEKAVNDAYTAKEGYRITVTTPGVVTLPDTITPTGGCSRPPLDFARVQIIGGDDAGLYVYVATLGEWRQIDGLETGDDFPFGSEDEAGVAAQLAVAMQDEYGANYQAGPRTLAEAATSVAAFRARFMKAALTDYSRPSDYWDGCPPIQDYA